MRVVKSTELFTMQSTAAFTMEPLATYGEEVCLRLLNRTEDVLDGTAQYCTACQAGNTAPYPTSSVQSRLATLYGSSGDTFCSTCYGTGIDPPYKPIIYHTFMLAKDAREQRIRDKTGQGWKENPRVNFPGVPLLKEKDLVIRIEQWDTATDTPLLSGERFEIGQVQPRTIRTGPANSITVGQTLYNQPFQQLVGQIATLNNLPLNHPLYNVDYVGTPSTVDDPNTDTYYEGEL